MGASSVAGIGVKPHIYRWVGGWARCSVVVETHYVLSSDMQHDSAFVQKAFDDHIFPYVKSVTSGIKTVCVRSDGCKAQFK